MHDVKYYIFKQIILKKFEIPIFAQAYFDKHSLKDPSAKKKGLIVLSDKMTCKKIHSDYKAYSLLDPGKNENEQDLLVF